MGIRVLLEYVYFKQILILGDANLRYIFIEVDM